MTRKAKKRKSSYLAAIDTAGARAELDALLAEFIVADHQESKDLLLKTIDAHGLRSDDTMMAISALQHRLATRPMLYTKLVKLGVKYNLPVIPESQQHPQNAERKVKRRTTPERAIRAALGAEPQ